ncbi:hypothetical protein D3C73_1655710 [compost metagenome]
MMKTNQMISMPTMVRSRIKISLYSVKSWMIFTFIMSRKATHTNRNPLRKT